MAEFDRRGFAAVDAFFREEEEKVSSTQEASGAPVASDHDHDGRRGPRRLGLGATISTKSPSHNGSSKLVSGMNKRILQVGKKRPRDASEDEEEKSLVSEDGEDVDDDLGRTAMAGLSSTSVPKSAALLAKESVDMRIKKQKKRKKGKKERALEKATTKEIAIDQPRPVGKQEATVTEGRSDDNDQPRPQKRKRRKVRSRQKNIYKDKREKKPDYLVPGKRNYQGRPLTTETRIKLNLGPSRQRSTINDDKKERTTGEDWNSSSWADFDETQWGTTIDSLPLVVDNDNTTGKVATVTSRDRSSTKRKSKYKNLR